MKCIIYVCYIYLYKLKYYYCVCTYHSRKLNVYLNVYIHLFALVWRKVGNEVSYLTLGSLYLSCRVRDTAWSWIINNHKSILTTVLYIYPDSRFDLIHCICGQNYLEPFECNRVCILVILIISIYLTTRTKSQVRVTFIYVDFKYK